MRELRGERLDDPLLYLYEAGGCAACISAATRTSERVLIHVGGFNLASSCDNIASVRRGGLQGRLAAILAVLLVLNRAFWEPVRRHERLARYFSPLDPRSIARCLLATGGVSGTAFTTAS